MKGIRELYILVDAIQPTPTPIAHPCMYIIKYTYIINKEIYIASPNPISELSFTLK